MSRGFVDASIEKVLHTLAEAFVLVSLVVFVFLGDWRSTLIPILAVPVSLVGAFAVMSAFGLSINLITLFALVLAIGIVVDDAIVVVEAVHAKMEAEHVTPLCRVEKSVGGNRWRDCGDHLGHGVGIHPDCVHVRAGRRILSTVRYRHVIVYRHFSNRGIIAFSCVMRDDP